MSLQVPLDFVSIDFVISVVKLLFSNSKLLVSYGNPNISEQSATDAMGYTIIWTIFVFLLPIVTRNVTVGLSAIDYPHICFARARAYSAL